MDPNSKRKAPPAANSFRSWYGKTVRQSSDALDHGTSTPGANDRSRSRRTCGNQWPENSTNAGSSDGQGYTREYPGALSKASPSQPNKPFVPRRNHDAHDADVQALKVELRAAEARATEQKDYTQNLITEFTAYNMRVERREEHDMQVTADLNNKSEQLEEAQRNLWQQNHMYRGEVQVSDRMAKSETQELNIERNELNKAHERVEQLSQQNDDKTAQLNLKSEQLEEAQRKLWHQCHAYRSELHVSRRIAQSQKSDYDKRVEQLSEQNTHKASELEVQRRQMEETRRELHAELQRCKTYESEMHAANRKAFSEKQKLNTVRTELTEEHERVDELNEYTNRKTTELQADRDHFLSAWRHSQSMQIRLQDSLRITNKKNEELESTANYHWERHQHLEAETEANQRERSQMTEAVMKLQDVAKALHDYHIGTEQPG